MINNKVMEEAGEVRCASIDPIVLGWMIRLSSSFIRCHGLESSPRDITVLKILREGCVAYYGCTRLQGLIF